MTHDEHRDRHKVLHAMLDELLADYMRHHAEQIQFLNMPLSQLMEWSFEQTQQPTELTTKGQ